MLHVNTNRTTFSPDVSRGTVAVESDMAMEGNSFAGAFQELESLDARHIALQYAATRGMASPRLNGNPTAPYPINSEGLSLDAVRDDKNNPLPANHPRMQPARYGIDVPVTTPIR